MADKNSNIRFTNPPAISAPVGYSHIAEITGGRLVFISGQVALDADGNLVGPGDFAAQAEQVFANLKAALESVGADFRSVAKLNFYVTDFSQLQAARDIRDRYVDTANPPASTAVQVSRLFREDLLIEVEAVAVVAA